MKKTYLYDFFNSLSIQTFKNFDLVVINDGYVGFGEFIEEFNSLNIIELHSSDTPAKNREFGINFVRKNNYDILVFGDSDDYFSTNRIEISINKLKHSNIVVNDLSLFNEADGIFSKQYLSERISNNSKIEIDYIKEKNIFGMTNSAVNVKILQEVIFDKRLVAVDWHLFSILLLARHEAIFTNETETFYRQYDGNTIGIGSKTDESVLKSIEVKTNHYELLQEKHEQFKILYKKMCELKKEIKSVNGIDSLSKKTRQNLFWWE